jgi:BolA family transcriptional regulator, general stress-responsive regulator
MKVSDRIRQKLEAALQPKRLEIYNDSHLHAGHHGGAQRGEETHFRLEIVAASFAGQSRLARQRQVHTILAEELAGPVHALQLQTRTPDEDQAGPT